MSTDNALLGANLRMLRKKYQVSQLEIEKSCGVTQQLLSRVELGEAKSIKAETLLSLAHFFGVRPEWLLTGQGTPYSEGVLPLLTQEQAANHLKFIGKYSLSCSQPLVSVAPAILAHIWGPAFAWEITDAALPAGFPPQSIVVVDAGVEPRFGQLVLTRLPQAPWTQLGVLSEVDDSLAALTFSNPSFEPIQILKTSVIGVAIHVQHTFCRSHVFV
jgi:transcriptional regulator with XRE-family HTH domain